MKLKSFRIKNFRSIEDTKCNVSDVLTIFAGKNESGKTTILDALMFLNEDIEFKDGDKPLTGSSEDTSITYVFNLNENEIKQSFQTTEIIPELTDAEVTIEYWPELKEYDISGNIVQFANDIFTTNNAKILPEMNEQIRKIKPMLDTLEGFSISECSVLNKTAIDDYIQLVKEIENKIPRDPKTNQSTLPGLTTEINSLLEKLLKIQEQSDIVRSNIWNLRPKIVKFSSFEDTLPSEIPYSEFTNEGLKNNYPIIRDLCSLAEIDLDKVQTEDRQARENLTELAARITTKKFKEFWRQNPVEFIFRIDQSYVSIFIRDEGKASSYKPEQRSKGFQWFLSFYLRLEAQGNEENTIILIDEPGLYLHARAQRDVLEVLERESEKNQILFTTHSPYLLNPDELNRVRLVIKDEKTDKTTVTNSYYKGADSDTLTPLVTAIGLDLTRDLLFSKNTNLVLEGISDYYYLRAMIEYLKRIENYSFLNDVSLIPCVGGANISLIVSLLIGLELPYMILLDKKGNVKLLNKLKKNGITDDEIILVGIESNDSIEELFDEQDRTKYAIDSNSENKAAVSRKFYERVKKLEIQDLSPTTLDNFRNLLETIKQRKIVSENLIETTESKNLENSIEAIESDLANIIVSLNTKYSLSLQQDDYNRLTAKYMEKIKALGKLSKEATEPIKQELELEMKSMSEK